MRSETSDVRLDVMLRLGVVLAKTHRSHRSGGDGGDTWSVEGDLACLLFNFSSIILLLSKS